MRLMKMAHGGIQGFDFFVFHLGVSLRLVFRLNFRAGGQVSYDYYEKRKSEFGIPLGMASLFTDQGFSATRQSCSGSEQVRDAGAQPCLAIKQVCFIAKQVCFTTKQVCYVIKQVCFRPAQTHFSLPQIRFLPT
jgi:hypothetical protein